MFTSHGYEKESEDSDTNQMKENISSISESQSIQNNWTACHSVGFAEY
jgi:hypothetical protein